MCSLLWITFGNFQKAFNFMGLVIRTDKWSSIRSNKWLVSRRFRVNPYNQPLVLKISIIRNPKFSPRQETCLLDEMITDDPIPDWKFLFPCSITHYDTVQKFCTSTILIILFTLVSKFMLYLQPPWNFVEIIAYFDFTIKMFYCYFKKF